MRGLPLLRLNARFSMARPQPSLRHRNSRFDCPVKLLSSITAPPVFRSKQRPPIAIQTLLAKSRPRDVLEGLTQGIQMAVAGILAALLVAITTIASAFLGVRRRGLAYFAKCFGVGAAGGFLLSACGMLAGVAQLVRGVKSTPGAIRARAAEQIWDDGTWIDVDLTASRSALAHMESQRAENTHDQTASEVVDTELYDLLKVSPSASSQEIKKTYYREARRCHPDIKPDDPEAKAEFMRLAEAYKVLSDVELRRQYDCHGKDAVQNANPLSKMDPVLFFSLLFGSEQFEPWVGELDLAMRADQISKSGVFRRKDTMSRKTQKELLDSIRKSMQGAEELRRRRFRRDVLCAEHLQGKLDKCATSRDASGDELWERTVRQEATDLAQGQHGPELLLALGSAHLIQARLYLGEKLTGCAPLAKLNQTQLKWCYRWYALRAMLKSFLGVTRGLEGVRKAAPSNYENHIQVQAALDEALPSFIHCAQKIVLMDVDHTAQRSAQMVLYDKSASPDLRLRRARALKRLGYIFQSVGRSACAATSSQSLSTASAKASVAEAFAASVKNQQQRNHAEGKPDTQGTRRAD